MKPDQGSKATAHLWLCTFRQAVLLMTQSSLWKELRQLTHAACVVMSFCQSSCLYTAGLAAASICFVAPCQLAICSTLLLEASLITDLHDYEAEAQEPLVLQPFKPSKLLYSDYAQLPKQREQELQAEYVSMEDLVK